VPAVAALHRATLLCLLAAAAFTARAERAHYALDPVHTRVLFAVSHAGFSHALGTVSGTTGALDFDPDDLRSAHVEANVPLARLELGDEKWNAAATKLLEAKSHPVATFVSTRVEPIDAAHATVIGTLTLNGIAQEVRLDVTFNQLRRHPLPPFRRTAGFSATTMLSRKAFGITDWPSVIGDAVELRIEAEAVRARGSVAEDLDIDLPPAEDLHPAPDENLQPPPQPGAASEPPATP
jgi:polyisoprenoid-binding protein YceI